MDEPNSRNSLIIFLQDIAEKGILTEEKRIDRGSYKGIYSHKYGDKELKQRLSEHVISRLLKELPEETRKAIKKHGKKETNIGNHFILSFSTR
jgi:hypothetical protein